MSVLGIGGAELVLIGMLIILILGPERAPQAARALGRQWRRWTTSEWWAGMSQFAYSVRNLPQTLTKLAEIEDLQAQLSEDMKTVQQVQQEIQEVAKPAQEVLSGKPIREAVGSLEADLKGGPPLRQPAAAPEGEQMGAEAAPKTPEPVGPATEADPATPGTTAPDSGQADPLPEGPAHQPPAYMDQLPVLFERMEQLERQYAQLLEQFEAMRRDNQPQGRNGPGVDGS